MLLHTTTEFENKSNPDTTEVSTLLFTSRRVKSVFSHHSGIKAIFMQSPPFSEAQINLTIFWKPVSWECVVFCFSIPPQIRLRKGLELSANSGFAFSGLVKLSIWGPKRCWYKWPPLRSKNKAHPWHNKSTGRDQINNLVHPPQKQTHWETQQHQQTWKNPEDN